MGINRYRFEKKYWLTFHRVMVLMPSLEIIVVNSGEVTDRERSDTPTCCKRMVQQKLYLVGGNTLQMPNI